MTVRITEVHFEWPTNSDWGFYIESKIGTDLVDYTGAEIDFRAKDSNGCERLHATVGSGISLATPTQPYVSFSQSTMRGLCPGTYSVGAVYRIGGVTKPIFVGSLTLFDGVAQIG